MDLRQYVNAISKYWWVILLAGVLGTGFGVLDASRTEQSYRSSVTFFIATRGDATTSAAVQGDQFAQRRVNSYVALLTTDRLARMVVAESGVDLTPGQVRSMIDGSGDLDTVLLTASVTSSSRALAQDLSSAVATEFVDLVADVEGGGSGTGSVALEVVSGPTVRPVPMRRTFTVASYTALTLALGVALAVLLKLRDHAVRSSEDLRELGLEPVLAAIPTGGRGSDVPLYVEEGPQSVSAESFRHLRTNLQFLDAEHSIQVLVVSSSIAGEGKSLICGNLALTIAASGRRVLLIDADLRRPGLGTQFDIDQVPGLSDVLVGRARLDQALRLWEGNLTLMPCGYLPPNPAEILDGEAMRTLLRDLRDRFDVILVDTPPLVPVTDGAVLAALADGVILVVRQGKPTRHQLALAAQRLDLVGARLLGSVLNMVAPGATSAYAIYDRQVPRDGHAATGRPPKGRPSSAPAGTEPPVLVEEGAMEARDEPAPGAPGPAGSPPAAGGEGELTVKRREDQARRSVVDRGDGYRIEP